MSEWKPQEPVDPDEVQRKRDVVQDDSENDFLRMVTQVLWMGEKETFGLNAVPDLTGDAVGIVQEYCDRLVESLESVGMIEPEEIEIEVKKNEQVE